MPLNIDWQQILLHAFNLVLLFMIFYLLLYKPVKKFMDARKQYYQDMNDQAEKAVRDGEAVKAEYEAKMAKAVAEIDDMKQQAQREADEMSDHVIGEAKTAANRIMDEAKAEAKREQERIVSEAGEEISHLVTEATAKIVFSDTNHAYESFLNNVEGSDGHGAK